MADRLTFRNHVEAIGDYTMQPSLGSDMRAVKDNALVDFSTVLDPDAGFLPSPGTVLGLRAPDGPGVRDDSGVEKGAEIYSKA